MKHISSDILDLDQETVVSGDEVIRDRNLSVSKRIDIHYMRLRQIANEREPEGGETIEQILADLRITYDS